MKCTCQAHKVVLCDSKTLLAVVPIQGNSNLENFPRPGMMSNDGIAIRKNTSVLYQLLTPVLFPSFD